MNVRSFRGLSHRAGVVLALAIAGVVPAGPLLEDLLTYPVIDQQCPEWRGRDEGLNLLAAGKCGYEVLTPGTPLGQTVTLGPDAVELWRVCLAPCWFPDNWTAGETVVFSLYDTPARGECLYQRAIPFERKWFKWDVAFDIMQPARAGAGYYLELSLENTGDGDGAVSVMTIPGNEYERGQAYVGGEPADEFDLYFVVLTRPANAGAAGVERFLDQFDLGFPPLAEAGQARANGDLDRACELILEHFRTRTVPDSLVPDPVSTDQVDLRRVDSVAREGRYCKNVEVQDADYIPMGRETTWRESKATAADPYESSYIRQNDLFGDLGRAWQATRDPVYARKLDELMLDYMLDNPSPFEGGMSGGRWHAMFVAWRLGDAWNGWGAVLDCEHVRDDVKLGWLDYWCRMARYVEHEEAGGNQKNAANEALLAFASRFPEFRESAHWRELAFRRLTENTLRLFRDDGGCREPAMNYHGFSLVTLMAGIDTARRHGMSVPADVWQRLERVHEFSTFMLQPDGQDPSNGDTDCVEFRPGYERWTGNRDKWAVGGADLFGREDMRFVGTAGRAGRPPDTDSRLFPDTLYGILRSPWSPAPGEGFEDARQLLFRAGPYGSHGHRDFNQVTLCGYGRSLVLDPGRTEYGTPLMAELSRNRSHNVLLVDDLGMNHKPEPRLHAWHHTGVLDVMDNSYAGLYPGIDHRRTVFFVRPDYYVLFDRVRSDDVHDFGLNFWLPPPELGLDLDRNRVWSATPGAANVLIQGLGPGLEIGQRHGTLDKGDPLLTAIPVVTLWRRRSLSPRFATILFPYPRGSRAPELELEVGADGSVLRVARVDGGADLLGLAPESGRGDGFGLRFRGHSVLVRLDRHGRIAAFAACRATSVVFGDEVLFESAEVCESVSEVRSQGRAALEP